MFLLERTYEHIYNNLFYIIQYLRENIIKTNFNIIKYLKPYKKEIVLTTTCVLIFVGINLYLPYITRLIIDGLANDLLSKNDLYKYLITYGVLGTICVIFSRTLRQIPLKLSHKIEYILRKDIFTHLTTLDQKYYRSVRTGDLMTRLSSDINLVRDAIGQGLLQGIRTVIVLLFSLIVMLLTDAQLALTVYILYIPMVIIFFVILRIMRQKQKELQEHVSDLSSFSQESFTGIRCIKGFAIEERRNNQFELVNQGLIRKNMIVQATRQSLWPFMSFWFGLGMILILNLGGRRVVTGELSLGTITQFIQYLLYMQWPLLALSWTSSLYQRGAVSWQRIKEIIFSEPEIKNPLNESKKVLSNYDIKFCNVCLSINSKKLLNNISLDIKTGTTIGITGPTGSGKSLLISLITRLNDPTKGSISLNDIDLKKLSLTKLRNLIGYASQEPILFSQSIEYNIGYGLENFNQEIINWGADTAQLKSDIETFPKGLQTIVGERGVTLSGGLKQRTAIARAITKNPKILILDDILSAVDTQTEASILNNLKPIISSATTFFISHRISSLKHTDRIIVIENGSITQDGTHDELINQSGYYFDLNKMQKLENKLEVANENY